MVTSDFTPEVEIMAVSCMHHASGHNYYQKSSFIVNWLWDRYHVPRNVFLVANASSDISRN